MSKNPSEMPNRFAALSDVTFEEKKTVTKEETAKTVKPEATSKEDKVKETVKEKKKEEERAKEASKEKPIEEKEEKSNTSQAAKKPEPSKPSVSESKPLGAPTSIRITEEQKNALLTIAAKKTLLTKKKVSTAEIIIEAIDSYIKKNKNFLE